MKVTVFGATGQLGKVAVPALVATGREVFAVVRRPEQVAEVEAQGATAVLCDLEAGENGDLAPVFADTDVVVWAAGANMSTGQEHSDRVDRIGAVRAIKAAADSGVKHWIQVSSMYADRADQGPPPLQPFLRNKAAADEALRESGMTWTVLRPGGLNNEAPTGKITVGTELGRMSITRADVADVIVEVLRSDDVANRGFDLGNGDTPIAAALTSL